MVNLVSAAPTDLAAAPGFAGQADAGVGVQLDCLAAELGLRVAWGTKNATLIRPDGIKVQTWREDYPYDRLMGRRQYEQAKLGLQIELLKLQRSVKAEGRRLAIVFEGRDAAGKGGTIRRFTENLNPRGTRIVALDKPTGPTPTRHYLRRYLGHLPVPGEIVLLDRSWYNRAGVERVMGFCRPEESAEFLRAAPEFERMLAQEGITLIKLWFSITRAEQLRRFANRQLDPVKQWKLSPIDLAALGKWDEYTSAKEEMFCRTDLPDSPWAVVKSNDKRRARLEAMRYVLYSQQYTGKNRRLVGKPDPLIVAPARRRTTRLQADQPA